MPAPTLLYFAYGSNMSPRQMARRCPGSRAVGRARLAGWRFQINARGGANLVPARAGEVHGVVWRIGLGHLARLDEWEGVAQRVYLRRRVRLRLDCGREISAIVYIAPLRRPGRPKPSYLPSAVLHGAAAFGLPDVHIAEIRRWQPRSRVGAGRQVYVGRRIRRRQGR